jgi:hypothetical protein
VLTASSNIAYYPGGPARVGPGPSGPHLGHSVGGPFLLWPARQVPPRCLVIAARTATTNHRRRSPRPGCHHHRPPTQPRHRSPGRATGPENRRRRRLRGSPAARGPRPAPAGGQLVTRAMLHDHALVLDHGAPGGCPTARFSVIARRTMITAFRAAATRCGAVPVRPAWPPRAPSAPPRTRHRHREPLQPPASEQPGWLVTRLDQNAPSFAYPPRGRPGRAGWMTGQ